VQNEEHVPQSKEADVTAQPKEMQSRQCQRQRVSAYSLVRHKTFEIMRTYKDKKKEDEKCSCFAFCFIGNDI